MLRTINRLHILLGRHRFSTLNDIGESAESIDYSLCISPNRTFAVRAERVGNHDFTSVDVSRKHLEGAELNLTHTLVREYVYTVRGDSTDVRTLSSLPDIDVIVTNPPYGIRSHSRKKIGGFYRSLLHALRERFRVVRVALITASWKQLREAALEEGFRVVEELPVLHGGLWTRMFLLSG